ncbi:hypothetical protein [Burkholderia multivorans]|uniref:hypothetical protein n=1 Tax=Burkholderia multivorans TaxID=87883 RepID=UPI0015E283A3|nr:hypothetical protein [Burkholderia multivorans]MBR7894453.1 hypothetical protein [Burkholderia multivorans]MDN7432118.1 hypothetical protein [Burkholderia multivorans]
MTGILIELVEIAVDAPCARFGALSGLLAAFDVAIDPLDVALVGALRCRRVVAYRRALAVGMADEVRSTVRHDQHEYGCCCGRAPVTWIKVGKVDHCVQLPSPQPART